jgi:hypothetical protein
MSVLQNIITISERELDVSWNAGKNSDAIRKILKREKWKNIYICQL